jgi:plastocyanin
MSNLGRARFRRTRLTSIALVLSAALLGALSLGEGGPRGAAKTLYRTTGDEGVIAGVVSVEGAVPPPRAVYMGADPYCERQYRGGPTLDDLVVKVGRLAGAFVYVRGGALERFEFEPPAAAAVFDERKCRFVPHVLGLQTGQTLRFINAEGTAHNPVVRAEKNGSFNRGLSPAEKGRVPSFFEVKLKEPEMPLTVRCNQHPWERGYLMVMAHPFFAVTDENGAFRIGGLPPGDYEVVLWHGRLKGRAAKASVGRRESRGVNFALRFPEDDGEPPAETPRP